MNAVGIGFGKVIQIAYLVEDVDVAMKEWMRHVGIGPWTCFRNVDLDAIFDDKPMTLRIHEALAYMGDLQIQLVQCLNPAEELSPFQEFIKANRWGVHHMAFFSHDIDADVARAREQGFERTCQMWDKGGYRYVYCQSTTMPDVWIEFLEVYPMLEDIFTEGIADTANWDGADPIRNFEYQDL